jgi:hypothetical protein
MQREAWKRKDKRMPALAKYNNYAFYYHFTICILFFENIKFTDAHCQVSRLFQPFPPVSIVSTVSIRRFTVPTVPTASNVDLRSQQFLVNRMFLTVPAVPTVPSQPTVPNCPERPNKSNCFDNTNTANQPTFPKFIKCA